MWVSSLPSSQSILPSQTLLEGTHWSFAHTKELSLHLLPNKNKKKRYSSFILIHISAYQLVRRIIQAFSNEHTFVCFVALIQAIVDTVTNFGIGYTLSISASMISNGAVAYKHEKIWRMIDGKSKCSKEFFFKQKRLQLGKKISLIPLHPVTSSLWSPQSSFPSHIDAPLIHFMLLHKKWVCGQVEGKPPSVMYKEKLPYQLNWCTLIIVMIMFQNPSFIRI